jgi:C1A family cysteine protease
MKFTVLALTAAVSSAMSTYEALKAQPCTRSMPMNQRPSHVISEITTVPIDQLPKNYDYGNINGVNFLTNIRNQHIPQYCGSCWAHAATSALSDRIKFYRNAQWPDINLSPQLIISCEQQDDGCHGGYAINAYQWIHENYITDETCSIY